MQLDVSECQGESIKDRLPNTGVHFLKMDTYDRELLAGFFRIATILGIGNLP